jgi:hypothetical protein
MRRPTFMVLALVWILVACTQVPHLTQIPSPTLPPTWGPQGIINPTTIQAYIDEVHLEQTTRIELTNPVTHEQVVITSMPTIQAILNLVSLSTENCTGAQVSIGNEFMFIMYVPGDVDEQVISVDYHPAENEIFMDTIATSNYPYQIQGTYSVCPDFGKSLFELLGIDVSSTLPPDLPLPSLTIKPSKTDTPVSTPIVIVNDNSGPVYNLVFSVPVGENGVRYQGVGIEESEITGPNALAILPDGRIIISDLLNNRLLYYKPDGKLDRTLDLTSLGIINVTNLWVSSTCIFIKEVSFYVSPTRYRVDKLSLEGDLIAFYDIPKEYRLADNLPGIIVDGDGRLLMDVENVSVPSTYNGQLSGDVIQLVDSQGNWEPATTDGLFYFGKVFRQFPQYLTNRDDNRGVVIAGDIRVETPLTMGLGGLQILGVLPDGHFYLIRTDVVQFSPTIQVDQTVHLMSPDGIELGVARYPITERYYPIEQNLALGPDGYVYALMPRETSLDVIRVNFYKDIEPLITSTAEPIIINPSLNP